MIARDFSLGVLLACLIGLSATAAHGPAVNESARDVPVAYDVDVVIVGGSTGAVSAAVAAAESGVEVFLAAPYPYLGEDMTATLRLWLEEGETPTSPLAKRVFGDTLLGGEQADPNRLPFTYTTDVPSAPPHQDTQANTVLKDGRWSDPARQSVQYDGDVNVTVDLGQLQPIAEVRVMVFHRDSGQGGTNFKVKTATIFAGDDGKTFQELAVIQNKHRGDGRTTLSAPVSTKARYLKVSVKKTDDVKRVLLGEIEVIRPASATVKAPPRPRPPRPMHVKKTLDEALLGAGVKFLYNCYATDVIKDTSGNPCGIVMANRAGRQAVIAKRMIDATDRAVVARLAGAEFRPYPAGRHKFQRVVIGDEVQSAAGMTSRVIDPPFLGPFPNRAGTSSGEFQIVQYTIELPMKDDSYASWAAAEQRARALTYHPEQQFTSDALFQVPPDWMHGRTPASGGRGSIADLPLGAFQPADVKGIYVLGGCVDVSRDRAAQLLRPLALMDLGVRIGKAVAKEAKSLPGPRGARLAGKVTATPAARGDVKEFLQGVRAIQSLPTVRQDARAISVLGKYDVVVIGGGTAGAPAGIGAARRGAKTLVVEHLHALGGVGTAGYISNYYWGNRVGFTASIPTGNSWVPEHKTEWWRSETLTAGAELWYGTIGCGALVDKGKVVGAVLATPLGRGVVLADVVIDTTGNADVAAAAGAEILYTDQTEFGMQGTGLPPRNLGATYTNTDFSIVDETDMLDVWHFFVYAKDKYPDAFDQGQLIDTRERRRIVGEYTVTILDQMLHRTFPDSIVRARSNFDTHGYTVHPIFEVNHPDKGGFLVYVPYRCNVPKGLEGILVGGLGVSAHRDAIPLIRMQADMQNQGYALGVAAAMVSQAGTLVRHVDIQQLKEHLVQIGNLPKSVLTDKDSLPLSDERIAEAVAELKDSHEHAAAIFSSPERAVPLLTKAYAAADEKSRVRYAHVLAALGNDTGLKTLVTEVSATKGWDAGWNYRGMGQFGSALSRLDTLIVALGRTRSRQAVPAVLKKMELLSADSEFSHHRASALALELIGDRSAAEALAGLLKKPGMTGHVHDTVEKARQRQLPGGTTAVITRRESLRELMLARALYRCGDFDGLGKKILQAYTTDLRGHLARHAQAVLQSDRR